MIEYGDDELATVLEALERMEHHLTAAVVSNDITFLQHVLAHTVNGTTYAGLRARTTGKLDGCQMEAAAMQQLCVGTAELPAMDAAAALFWGATLCVRACVPALGVRLQCCEVGGRSGDA